MLPRFLFSLLFFLVPSLTVNAAQVSLPTSTLPRSHSSASIVSQVSVSGGTSKADDPEDKRGKFDERFKTATSTDEEVLSKSFGL